MKKLGLLLFAGALTLGLGACGGTEEETKSQDVSEETTTEQEETVEASSSSGAEEITITATNWDFTSDKELVIKKGTKVKFNLVNAEGMHTIANEELGINLTADAPAEFTADTTGDFELICNQICGSMEDHEAMKISLKIVD
jgi:cytochrome c oxidase subunit II